MFLDDKTEMAGVVTKPNGESMEYAQASGSLLCRCMTEPRYRQYRMRACEEEYDVCSYFPRSLIAESEFYTGIKRWIDEHDDRFGEDAAQRVLRASNS